MRSPSQTPATSIPVRRGALFRGIVDGRRVLDRDRKRQTADRGIGTDGLQAVQGVGRDLHQVALTDLALLSFDPHQAAARDYVVEFEGRMLVGMHLPPAQ